MTTFFNAITNPGLWRRIGVGSIGVALIVIGVIAIFREPVKSGIKAGIDTAKTAAKVAAVV